MPVAQLPGADTPDGRPVPADDLLERGRVAGLGEAAEQVGVGPIRVRPVGKAVQVADDRIEGRVRHGVGSGHGQGRWLRPL